MTTTSGGDLSNGEVSRREIVLQKLRSSGEARTIADLADELGVHPNTIRFHLGALCNEGRAERVAGVKSGLGRPPTRYLAIEAMNPNGPTNYRFLAAALTSHFAATSPDPAADARALGREWSATLIGRPESAEGPPRTTTRGAAVKRVAAELANLGFAPDPVGARSTEIRLRHCPFLELVPAGSDVICSLHLGLMEGVFEALEGPVTVDRLVPFSEPDLCVARLVTT